LVLSGLRSFNASRTDESNAAKNKVSNNDLLLFFTQFGYSSGRFGCCGAALVAVELVSPGVTRLFSSFSGTPLRSFWYCLIKSFEKDEKHRYEQEDLRWEPAVSNHGTGTDRFVLTSRPGRFRQHNHGQKYRPIKRLRIRRDAC